jgi:hypothetical protein
MPNDLRITAITPAKPAPMDSHPAPQQEAAPSTATAAPSYPNPSMHIDPALNIVVIEFRNTAGTVTDTTPTEQQLDAYRQTMWSKPTNGG